MWRFKCDCGADVVARKNHVAVGATKSCGCYAKEMLAVKTLTHGMSRTPTWNSWAMMLQRCEDQKHTQYKDYGGRGIDVCERWHDFSNFYADMGGRPLGKTLDRIDNSKGYEPDNCRWATWHEQNAAGRRRVSHRASS